GVDIDGNPSPQHLKRGRGGLSRLGSSSGTRWRETTGKHRAQGCKQRVPHPAPARERVVMTATIHVVLPRNTTIVDTMANSVRRLQDTDASGRLILAMSSAHADQAPVAGTRRKVPSCNNFGGYAGHKRRVERVGAMAALDHCGANCCAAASIITI